MTNGYSRRHEAFRIDGQRLWDHAIQFTGGSTLQWGMKRGFLCLAAHVVTVIIIIY